MNRRDACGAMALLALGASGTLSGMAPGTARAQTGDWRKRYPVVSFSSVSSESQGATEARFKDFAKVFKEHLGVDLRVFTATDYAGTIQALTGGQIQLAGLGPAAYASAWIDSNGEVEPLVAAVEADGDFGYHSSLIVKADSPYQKLDDLRGKTLAWADPNSASGYLVPLVSLRAAGVEADKFFGRTAFSGGHEQSVIGVGKGAFDCAFVWSAKDTTQRGILRAMSDRKLIEQHQFRVVWQSPVIPNSPLTVRKDLPADMKRDLTRLWTELYGFDPKMAETLARGKTLGYRPVTHEMYEPMLKVIQEQRRNRKTAG
jgi:phosphonate transport system substrate-binding protein